VDWDDIKINGKIMTYKELRSSIKNGKISAFDTHEAVSKHLHKKLGENTFRHKESQKEGVIQMD
jgi:hypothetical protein